MIEAGQPSRNACMSLKTRRALLKDAAVASAALLMGGCEAAHRRGDADQAESGGPPAEVCWALVADTHVNPSAEATERGQNMHDNFRAVVRDALQPHRKIAGMIINGDIAHRRGDSGAYRLILELLAPVRRSGIDLRLAMGNHDNRDHFLSAFPDEQQRPPHVAAKHVEAFNTGPVRMIVLDSLIRPNHTPGELGVEQLHWLGSTLDAQPRIPTLLFVHHDLGESGGSLQDTPALIELITPRRQVKAVFQGHNHEYSFREVEGVHLVKMPATSYVFGPDKPLGWLQATIKPDSCELLLRVLSADGIADGGTRVLQWRAG
ncbi:MAG: hypothetical protein AMXMBFR13_24770 [Phycisphaerae bacterium]